ncbi:MAG: GIY-YIG nuclease family protein, partial [Candidatus Sericytochromatia bacterium]|nr:GIY-YIG nuclease family protein [Candidatus Sericytochromatia bacterium]
MNRGKTIRVYLADGTATGIRHATLGNWSGQALLIPRTLYPKVRNWTELLKPGVYFLIGNELNDYYQKSVYIGESENIISRLDSHISSKPFWGEVVVFTNKDDYLTKAHVRYLESELIRTSRSSGRYAVENSTASNLTRLPRSDQDEM